MDELGVKGLNLLLKQLFLLSFLVEFVRSLLQGLNNIIFVLLYLPLLLLELDQL